MNFTTQQISGLMGRVWLIAMFMYGFAVTSCSSDNDAKEHDGKYIVTNPITTVGVTYAELSGEFYISNLPAAYANGQAMQLGVEMSTSERFEIDNRLSGYTNELQGGHFVATALGLEPSTKYYVRTFVEVGPTRLYGETQSFTTQPMELIVTAGDAAEVSFDQASVEVKFTAAPPSSPLEQINYGVIYSTDKSRFDKPSGMLDRNDVENNNIQVETIAYRGPVSQQVVLKKLESNTTYYYCACALAGQYFSYQLGPVKSFTTGSRDELMSIDAINVGFVVGEFTGTTKLSPSLKGVSYKLMYQQLDTEWDIVFDAPMTVNGNQLSAVLNTLHTGQRYLCWITAMQNNQVIGESERKEFKTGDPADCILLDEATNVTATTATITCRLDAEGYESNTNCSIYYGRDKNNLINSDLAVKKGDHMEITLKNLKPNTTYYYCAQALCTLAFGRADWYKSQVKSFTTLPE